MRSVKKNAPLFLKKCLLGAVCSCAVMLVIGGLGCGADEETSPEEPTPRKSNEAMEAQKADGADHATSKVKRNCDEEKYIVIKNSCLVWNKNFNDDIQGYKVEVKDIPKVIDKDSKEPELAKKTCTKFCFMNNVDGRKRQIAMSENGSLCMSETGHRQPIQVLTCFDQREKQPKIIASYEQRGLSAEHQKFLWDNVLINNWWGNQVLSWEKEGLIAATYGGSPFSSAEWQRFERYDDGQLKKKVETLSKWQ
jgi:hypothetical protein